MSAEASQKNFDRYGRYFDLLYRDKDYQGEVNYLVRSLRRFGLATGSLLEFGCGTGRHGQLLAAAGYRVHGIDRSEQMIARAHAQPPTAGFTCEVGDICSFQAGRAFDAVLSLFHVVSYQTSNEDLVAVFRNARGHLNAGGIFLFDVWYGPAVQAQRPTERVKTVEDDAIAVERAAHPTWRVNENRVDVHYRVAIRDKATGRVDRLEELHPMRYFSLPELDLLASFTGFHREFAEEFMSGQPPAETTWGVCVAMRAI